MDWTFRFTDAFIAWQGEDPPVWKMILGLMIGLLLFLIGPLILMAELVEKALWFRKAAQGREPEKADKAAKPDRPL